MYLVLARDAHLGASVKDWFDRRRLGLVELTPLDAASSPDPGRHAAPPSAVIIVSRALDETVLRACTDFGARSDDTGTPVIVALEDADETQRVALFDAGADAVVQPFDVRVIEWRVNSMCDRGRRPSGGYRALIPEKPATEIAGEGTHPQLTALEDAILTLLVQRADRVVGRALIEQRFWGEVKSRTLDVHVSRLRRKLGDGGKRIETIRKVGYRYSSSQPG
jgi:DNA-binding response OmpR family regulator